MKKKFDFSAEMSEAESIRSTPKNEYLEEENHLLDINVQELARLNNNVYKLRTEVENLSGSIRECKPIISEEMHKLAVEFGARLLCNFLDQIESKCKEAEILHSGLIWKATTGCILMAVSGIGITVAIQKFLDRGKQTKSLNRIEITTS